MSDASTAHVEWRYLLSELRTAIRIGMREGRNDLEAKTISIPWSCWDRLVELATKEGPLGCLECGDMASFLMNGLCSKCDQSGVSTSQAK